MSLADPALNDPDDEGAGESRQVTLNRSQIRALEKKAANADQLAETVARLEREAAFRDAGLDVTDPKAKWFVKGYDGEVKPDAIKAEAVAAGLLPEPGPTEEQTQQMSAGQRVAAASAGAPGQSSASPETLVAEMAAAFKTGGQDAMMAVARRFGAVSVDETQ